MPIVAFEALPPDAKVWVFAADKPLTADGEIVLLREVDAFLAEWHAHGSPLACARDWREGRFLAIGVDQSTGGASGCSIDGMFRVLQRLQPLLGTSLLPGPRVYWRDADGAVAGGARTEFKHLASAGTISASTHVFDTAAATAADWREKFERHAADSWHKDML